jgi:hypothetical protein
MHFGMFIAQKIMPWQFQLQDPQTGEPQLYLDLNFGELEFEWDADEPAVVAKIFGADGIVLEQRFALSGLGVQAGACVPLSGAVEKWREAFALAVLLVCAVAVVQRAKAH